MEVDHVLPLSLGGARLDPANLASRCRACHKHKTKLEAITAARAKRAEQRQNVHTQG